MLKSTQGGVFTKEMTAQQSQSIGARIPPVSSDTQEILGCRSTVFRAHEELLQQIVQHILPEIISTDTRPLLVQYSGVMGSRQCTFKTNNSAMGVKGYHSFSSRKLVVFELYKQSLLALQLQRRGEQ